MLSPTDVATNIRRYEVSLWRNARQLQFNTLDAVFFDTIKV